MVSYRNRFYLRLPHTHFPSSVLPISLRFPPLSAVRICSQFILHFCRLFPHFSLAYRERAFPGSVKTAEIKIENECTRDEEQRTDEILLTDTSFEIASPSAGSIPSPRFFSLLLLFTRDRFALFVFRSSFGTSHLLFVIRGSELCSPSSPRHHYENASRAHKEAILIRNVLYSFSLRFGLSLSASVERKGNWITFFKHLKNIKLHISFRLLSNFPIAVAAVELAHERRRKNEAEPKSVLFASIERNNRKIFSSTLSEY